jgi:hypothetical protein
MPSVDPGPGGQPGDVFVPATVGGLGAAFPICRASDLLGSHRTVTTLTDRDNISLAHRDEGMTVWVTATATQYRLVGGLTNAFWVVDAGGPTQQSTGSITPGVGQTLFVLPAVPLQPASVEFFVNQAAYIQGPDYTVAGANVTWTNARFTLDPLDEVEIRYWI